MKEIFGQKIISNSKMNFEFQDVLKKHQVKKVMIVSKSTYKKTYLYEWFQHMPYEFIQFEDFTPNPKYEDICKGVKLFLQENCDFIISIGGGSATDVAKCIKLFSKLNQNEDYLKQEFTNSDIPMIAIPTTAGSGSEANGNAVFYVNNEKYSFYNESVVPNYIYFEPTFLSTLPDYIRKSSLADAIAQCIESIWAKKATEESIEYATKGLKLLLENAMKFLRNDETSFESVQMGAYYSGKAIHISKTTAAHALSYKLSQVCNIAHGHAVFMLLPAVYKHLTDQLLEKNNEVTFDSEVDDEVFKRLKIIKDIIMPSADTFDKVKNQLDFILRILALPMPSFIGEDGIKELIEHVNLERLGNHPISLTKEDLHNIYIEAFRLEYNEENQLVLQLEYQEMLERQNFVSGLQKLTLETLLLSQKFLDEYGLTFFLSEGTLLGGIRHNGFIPWDDDVDIMMPRDDYDKLVQLAKDGKIPPELNFDALETNDKHWVLGAKLQLVRETEYIQRKVIPLSKCHGPYVDVFPLDYWPKAFSRKLYFTNLKVKLCRRMLFMKTGYSKATKKKFYRYILRLVCLFVSNRQIENYAIKNLTKYKNDQRKFFVHLCSYYPFYKEVFPMSCISGKVMVNFEGHPMPVPKDYDYILKTIYGPKYDTIPPYTVTDMRKHAFELNEDYKVDEQ